MVHIESVSILTLQANRDIDDPVDIEQARKDAQVQPFFPSPQVSLPCLVNVQDFWFQVRYLVANHFTVIRLDLLESLPAINTMHSYTSLLAQQKETFTIDPNVFPPYTCYEF